MFWSAMLIIITAAVFGWVALPALLVALGVRFARRRLKGADDASGRNGRPQLAGRSQRLLSDGRGAGCPAKERETLRKLEGRLEAAHASCIEAVNTRLSSELARARIAPPLEEAYTQIKDEITSIWAFCARNDLVGTLKKANTSTTAQDIYLNAYERDLEKLHAALDKTEACLAAYERTVATLEVSSVEADLTSDFDDSIEMLKDLRDELPLYNLEDKI